MPDPAEAVPHVPQLVLMDLFLPGFSTVIGAVQRYLHINLNLYFSIITFLGVLIVIWNYSSSYFWRQVAAHFMSNVDIRTDDEIYNIIMTWIANQEFSQSARRFVVNADLSSRSYYLRRWDLSSGDLDSDENANDKPLRYTPSFGTHYFWYRGRLLLFKRKQKEDKVNFRSVSENEEISICCFGRNPWIIKKLLLEARLLYNKKDRSKTLIYRAAERSNDLTWQRSLTRNPRPFSTIVMNEKVKRDIIDDVADYLRPASQRWYFNRGIPYRRGYLLYGPPGTGKSSLSLALAGHFGMRIYIVSLSSPKTNEESLFALFAELPTRCIVLLEDIDTAGLTHTREDDGDGPKPLRREPVAKGEDDADRPSKTNNAKDDHLSLSGLLNILDGVASQEGRVLIMTTNHVDKLDKALIRPGRVDMTVEFGRADADMTAAIFRAIFARLEGDTAPPSAAVEPAEPEKKQNETPEEEEEEARQKQLAEEMARRRREDEEEEDARVQGLALEFAACIPAHEFSPAELQGHLLKHKQNPRAAVDGAAEFVEQTRKDHKEQELEDAEDRRKADERKKRSDKAKKDEEIKNNNKRKREVKEEERRSKRKESKSSASDSYPTSDSEAGGEKDGTNKDSKKDKRGIKSKKDSKSG